MDATTARSLGTAIQIIDVREDDEWAAGHIDGALHIPLAQLPQRLSEIDTTRTPVTVCRAGGRSARAHALLTAAGRSAEDLTGGMQAWAADGLPVSTPVVRPGRVI